jgi:hypothetical protein
MSVRCPEEAVDKGSVLLSWFALARWDALHSCHVFAWKSELKHKALTIDDAE